MRRVALGLGLLRFEVQPRAAQAGRWLPFLRLAPQLSTQLFQGRQLDGDQLDQRADFAEKPGEILELFVLTRAGLGARLARKPGPSETSETRLETSETPVRPARAPVALGGAFGAKHLPASTQLDQAMPVKPPVSAVTSTDVGRQLDQAGASPFMDTENSAHDNHAPGLATGVSMVSQGFADGFRHGFSGSRKPCPRNLASP